MKAQFFTPVAVIALAIQFLNPISAHADSEIKIQGKSTTTGVWSEIEDDDDADDNDSPRGGNGTVFGNVKLGEINC